MSDRARRAHGVPATRGPMRIYRDGELVEKVSATRATAHAKTVVRDSQGRGRKGRDM